MKKLTLGNWVGLGGALFVPALAVATLQLPHTFKAGEPVSASAMNENFGALKAKIDDVEGRLDLHAQAPSWTLPTLLNGWQNYGLGYAEAGYRKDEHGVVHLGGMIDKGAATSPVFKLPVGYRPADTRSFVVLNGPKAFAQLEIWNTGEVFMPDGASSFTSLDGVSFIAQK